MIADAGAGLYAGQAPVDHVTLTKDDLINQVKDVIAAGELSNPASGRVASRR